MKTIILILKKKHLKYTETIKEEGSDYGTFNVKYKTKDIDILKCLFHSEHSLMCSTNVIALLNVNTAILLKRLELYTYL